MKSKETCKMRQNSDVRGQCLRHWESNYLHSLYLYDMSYHFLSLKLKVSPKYDDVSIYDGYHNDNHEL